MVSTGLLASVAGFGAFAAASSIPSAKGQVVARLAGLGVGAVGAAILFDDIRSAGGLAGLGDGLIRDIAESETRALSETPEAKLADPTQPSFTPERFVIPYVASFRPKPTPDEIQHNTLRNSYPLRVVLRNFTTSAVTSAFVVDAEEDAVFSSDVVQLVHEPVKVPAGGEVEVAFDMPLSPGLRAFRLFPFVTAKLTWPADFPFTPRQQDVVSFRVV